MESIVPGYQPLDLIAVYKTIPKTTKKISTDKDLENEVNEIEKVLKDISKYTKHFIFN